MQIINRVATDSPTAVRGRRTRRVGLLVVAAIAAALITGCGGSSSGVGVGVTHSNSTPARSAIRRPAKPSMLAFAQCMRAHGVPNYPDPKPPGQIPVVQTPQPAPSGGFTANPNSPAYQTASSDCKSLAVATKLSASQSNQVMAAQLNFAVCMRGHGAPNFPDPSNDGEIGNNGAISGVNQNSPAFRAARRNCSKLRPRPPIPVAGSSAPSGAG